MHRLAIRRRAGDLALDIVFVTWMAYVLVSGRVLPAQVVELFYNPAPITVMHESDDDDDRLPANLPIDRDADPEA